MNELFAQLDRITHLHRQWDTACHAFDRIESRETLVAMNAACAELNEAEATLVDMQRMEREDDPDLHYPGILM
jgi:hypothetical protein